MLKLKVEGLFYKQKRPRAAPCSIHLSVDPSTRPKPRAAPATSYPWTRSRGLLVVFRTRHPWLYPTTGENLRRFAGHRSQHRGGVEPHSRCLRFWVSEL